MDDKRQRILDAATTVFAEKGFEYATISAVAKEAGISTGIIYSYFKNKLDVLLSLLLIFLQTFNEVNAQRVTVLRNPFDKLYAFLHNCEDLLLKDDSCLCRVKILHEALPHIIMLKDKGLMPKRAEIMTANNHLIATIDEIMLQGQQQGVFDSSLKPTVMRQVLSGTIERVVYGLFFTRFTEEEIGYDRQDAHEALVRVIETFIKK